MAEKPAGFRRANGRPQPGGQAPSTAFQVRERLLGATLLEIQLETGRTLRGEALSPLFQAVIEATEEAVLNSMLKATTVVGRDGNTREALPLSDLLEVGARYNRLHPPGGS